MPMIFTADSVRDNLISANRDYYGRSSWNQAFGRIGDSYTIGKNSLDTNYSKAMNEAYLQNTKANSQIMGSNLGQGYKQLALEESQLAMQNAFDSYRSNYLSQLSQLESDTASTVGAVNSQLDAQASNVAKYAGYAFDYLPYLYEKDQSLFEKDPALARFVNRDENGAITGLKSIDELQEGMFNKDGSMTEAGIDFLNMVQNYGGTGNLGQNTFTQFLSEKDKGLLEWLSSADPYSAGKTNRDTFNDIAGTNSNLYNLTPDKLGQDNLTYFETNYNATHDDLVKTYEEGHKSLEDATNFINKQDTATKELIDFAKRIGATNDEEVAKLIVESEKNLVRYKDAIENDTTGINRKNREWATSNALADYESLYDAVMKASGGKSFGTTTERSDYRAYARVLKDYEAGKIDSATYTKYLKEAVSVTGQPKNNNNYQINYTLKGKGNESIVLHPDFNREVNSAGFKSFKSFTYKQRYGEFSDYDLGVLSNGDLAIKRAGKVYKVDYSDTSDNRAFVEYVRAMSSH